MADVALWINASAGAPSYDATELRQAMALALAHGGGQNLGARSGVRPGGTQLATSIAGSTITVQEGVACLYEPTPSATRAPYWVALPADENHTLTAAHATNPRKDITVLRVYDHDQDSSGLRLARSEYLVGTAAPSPSEPAVPAGAFRLATIDVPPSGGGSPAVTINHPFAVASGGIVPVRNSTEEAALDLYDGLVIYRIDTDVLRARVNGAWRDLFAIGASTMAAQPVEDYETANDVSSASTAYVPGTLNGVAFTSPPSGKVVITVDGALGTNHGALGLRSYLSFYVRNGATVGSGTDFMVPSDDRAAIMSSHSTDAGFKYSPASVRRLVTGLTPGNSYNATSVFRTDSIAGGGAAAVDNRSILVEPVL